MRSTTSTNPASAADRYRFSTRCMVTIAGPEPTVGEPPARAPRTASLEVLPGTATMRPRTPSRRKLATAASSGANSTSARRITTNRMSSSGNGWTHE